MDLDGWRFLCATVKDSLDLLFTGTAFAKEELLRLFIEVLNVYFPTRPLLPDEEVV